MLVHGVQCMLEMTQHFAPHDECYCVTSGGSEHCGEIGRKIWLMPTGHISLEFYDKMKHAFMMGSIVHMPYPTVPVWEGDARGQCVRGQHARHASVLPLEAVKGDETVT